MNSERTALVLLVGLAAAGCNNPSRKAEENIGTHQMAATNVTIRITGKTRHKFRKHRVDQMAIAMTNGTDSQVANGKVIRQKFSTAAGLPPIVAWNLENANQPVGGMPPGGLATCASGPGCRTLSEAEAAVGQPGVDFLFNTTS